MSMLPRIRLFCPECGALALTPTDDVLLRAIGPRESQFGEIYRRFAADWGQVSRRQVHRRIMLLVDAGYVKVSGRATWYRYSRVGRAARSSK